jgi:hypothetical protein
LEYQTVKRSFSVIARAALAVLSPILACFGCGGGRDPAPPPPPKIRWRGEETGYQNTTELESNRRPEPAPEKQSQEIPKP